MTLSKLATAVYGTRGDPPAGWSAVSDQQLRDLGVADPTAWRQQFLGGGEQTKAQEFKAEVYTDGNGNYVLSYRGTAEGWDDWQNNFKQGTGFQTDPVDKFSGTAVNTAREFQRVFGNPPGGAATNLAITGHSQGGGLATVGSLATGIPAVTFDASGIHPNTLDRMGLDPQAARDTAEGGQIRAYSLSSDLLTQTQEGGPLGLLAPDAMGTKIVVDPARADEHHMIDHYGAIELEGKSPEELAKLNALVEAARNTPWIPSDPLIGTSATTATDNFDEHHPLFHEIVALARLRTSHPALTRGRQVVRYAGDSPGLFAASRFDPGTGAEYLIAFNSAATPLEANVVVETRSTDFATLAGAGCSSRASAPGSLHLSLAPFGYAVCAEKAP